MLFEFLYLNFNNSILPEIFFDIVSKVIRTGIGNTCGMVFLLIPN